MPGQLRSTPTNSNAKKRRLLYTVNEAAAQLSMGRTKFYGLITSNTIPSIVLGGRRVVAHEDLVAYVDGLRAEAGPYEGAAPWLASSA
ncbi:helix-turn-helix domain-containing protein [Klenkia sp. LSe6-5]|uniref:Helix-turn-helix domain-containing protein n=1 Tax=Klenkia sesuvii TaxID=3103137 RepID=A0ABU8DYI2_9ACTN